jgi:hypothetical protein
MGIIARSSPGAEMYVIVQRMDVSIDEIASLNKINLHAFIQYTA